MGVSWNPKCGKRMTNVTEKIREKCQKYCWEYPEEDELPSQSEVSTSGVRVHFTDTDAGFRMTICDDLDITRLTVMVLIFTLNILLFFFILSNRKLRGSKANKFFLNLQSVHLILSTSGILMMFIERKPTDTEIVLNNGFLMEMFFSLIITTCDRYVQIVYPYMYQRFTTRKALLIILCSWMIPVIFIVAALNVRINQTHLTIISTITISIATTSLIFTNGKLYLVAKRACMTMVKNKNTRVLKSTYVCLSLVSSFVILWFPFLVHNILDLVGAYKADDNSAFTRIIVQVALINSIFDPIFFVVFRRDVKNEFRKLGRRYLHFRQFTKEHKRSMQQHGKGANNNNNNNITETGSTSVEQNLL